MIGDFTLEQLLLVSAFAFFTQIVSGIAGYGTGLLLPLVLVPLIGAEAVVPVISLAALITNPTRAITFWKFLDRRKTIFVTLYALPATAVGAYWFTLLTGRGAQAIVYRAESEGTVCALKAAHVHVVVDETRAMLRVNSPRKHPNVLAVQYVCTPEGDAGEMLFLGELIDGLLAVLGMRSP